MEDWRTQDEIAAFNEGLAAYRDEGKGDDQCPYPVKSRMGQSWLMGWDYGFERNYREEQAWAEQRHDLMHNRS